MAEVRLDVHDRAELAAIDQPLGLDQGRLEAPLVADPEYEAALAAGAHHLPGVGGEKRERLFAEHVPAGRSRRQDLGFVQRVRRREDYGPDRRIGERLLEARGQGQAMLRGERRGRTKGDRGPAGKAAGKPASKPSRGAKPAAKPRGKRP